MSCYYLDMKYTKELREELLQKTRETKFLYHGSKVRGLKQLLPYPGNQREPEMGPVVFATPFFDYATCFMGETRGKRVIINKWGAHSEYVLICSDEERYRREDTGGSVYKVNSPGFTFDENRGGGYDEWISREPVAVIEEVRFDSVLDAMIENFVQVYFVTRVQFQEMHDLSHHGLEFLEKMESVNQKIGKHVLPLAHGGEGLGELLRIRFGEYA